MYASTKQFWGSNSSTRSNSNLSSPRPPQPWPPTTTSLLPGYCNEWGAKMNTYLYIQIQIHTLVHTVICTNTDRIAISFFTSTTKALTPPYCPATVMSGGQKWMLRAKLWSPNNYLWSRFCKSQSKFKTNMYQYPVLILSTHTLDVVHLSNASILVSTGCLFFYWSMELIPPNREKWQSYIAI